MNELVPSMTENTVFGYLQLRSNLSRLFNVEVVLISDQVFPPQRLFFWVWRNCWWWRVWRMFRRERERWKSRNNWSALKMPWDYKQWLHTLLIDIIIDKWKGLSIFLCSFSAISLSVFLSLFLSLSLCLFVSLDQWFSTFGCWRSTIRIIHCFATHYITGFGKP